MLGMRLLLWSVSFDGFSQQNVMFFFCFKFVYPYKSVLMIILMLRELYLFRGGPAITVHSEGCNGLGPPCFIVYSDGPRLAGPLARPCSR